MKRFLGIFIVLLPISSMADPEEFVGDHTIKIFSKPEYLIQNTANVHLKSGYSDIIVETPVVSVVNHGTLTGDIDINGNILNIQNTGTVNGIIKNNASGGFVKQIISSDAEFTKLNIKEDTDFWVQISNIDNINVSNLINLDADHFIIDNSEIFINDFNQWQNLNTDISFGTNNILHIQNLNDSYVGQTIKYVNDIDSVSVENTDVDDLHKIFLSDTGAGIKINIVRESNYQKVFKDNRGVILENVRQNNPNDKFITLLDSMDNMSDLKHVMNSSYRFNHKFLIRPLSVMNNFVLMGYDDTLVGFKFNANYIGGNKIRGYGGFGRIGDVYDKVYLGFGVNVNKLNYHDDINDFDINIYGGNLKTKIDFDDFWINGITGFSIADYTADNIYYNNNIKNNPHGHSIYGALDIGHDFYLNNDLKIDLFTGLNGQFIKVLGDKDNDTNLRIGSNLKYWYEMIGIRYEYSLGGAVSSNGDMFGSLKIGFWSVADEAGVNIGFDVIKHEYDTNYQATINLKTMF